MRNWSYPYLEVLAEQVRKMNEILEVLAERKYGKRIFRPLAVKTKRNCGNNASDFKGSGRADALKLNFISLALNAEQKCASGTSHLLQFRQR